MMDILFVGLVACPMSDLFALVLMCTAVMFIKKNVTSSTKLVKLITAFLREFFATWRIM